MPIYTYKCLACGKTGDKIRSIADADESVPCHLCHKYMKRIPAKFSTTKPFDSHFNPSAGTFVRSPTHHADILKAQSEAATLRTGIEHNYVPINPRESKEMLGVTDEGMDATRRRAHDTAARHDVTVTDPDRHPTDAAAPRKADLWL